MFVLHTITKAGNRAFGFLAKAGTGAVSQAAWQRRVWFALALSLLLAGSGQQSIAGASAVAASIHADPAERNIAQFSKSDMMRYAYGLQAAVADDPALLTRIDGYKVRLILAEPDLLRKDGPTQSWQYRAGSCVLDVFMRDEDPNIVHYEFRSTDALNEEEPPHWQCLQGLYQTRRAAIEKSFEDIYADARRPNAG